MISQSSSSSLHKNLVVLTMLRRVVVIASQPQASKILPASLLRTNSLLPSSRSSFSSISFSPATCRRCSSSLSIHHLSSSGATNISKHTQPCISIRSESGLEKVRGFVRRNITSCAGKNFNNNAAGLQNIIRRRQQNFAFSQARGYNKCAVFKNKAPNRGKGGNKKCRQLKTKKAAAARLELVLLLSNPIHPLTHKFTYKYL